MPETSPRGSDATVSIEGEAGGLLALDSLGAAYLAGSVAQGGQICSEWLREVLGPGALEVRILLGTSGGQIRALAASGSGEGPGRRRSAHRREVLRTGSPCRIAVKRPAGSVLAIMALRSGTQPFGVVEVLFESPPQEDRWATLNVAVGHVGSILAGLRDREALQRQVDTLQRSAGLAAAMLEARTVPGSARAAARFCNERFRAPVASWWAKGDPGRLAFLTAYGLGAGRRTHLRETMDPIPAWASLSERDRERLVDRFREVAGVETVAVLDAGSALLLVAAQGPAVEETLGVVRSLLAETTRNLERVLAADQLDARVDLGLAWTAHEVRGPLQGVKAVIDLLLATTGPDQPLRDLLGRSSRELHDLAGQVETLLRWAVGPATLRRRPTDVVDLTRRAIESCALETGHRRVSLIGPERVVAHVDEVQFRSAVANLIRNALAYSSPDSPVQVRVRGSSDHVMVSVLDRGEGVASSERDQIFDPFVRGRRDRGRTAGAGLGLFIARRIVEAHGGSVWTEPGHDGAAFHVALPRAAGRRSAHPAPGTEPVRS